MLKVKLLEVCTGALVKIDLLYSQQNLEQMKVAEDSGEELTIIILILLRNRYTVDQ